MSARLCRFGYDLVMADEYTLELAEYLWESGLAVHEEESGPSGRHRTIIHREATPEHHDEFDRLYKRGSYR